MSLLSGFKNIYKKSEENTLFSRTEHNWFLSNPILSESFQILYKYAQQSPEVQKLLDQIIFLKVDGSYACALDSKNKFILVFPELFQLLQSAKRMQAIAVLMHELGHIALKHQENSVENQRAQIEADLFANELGLGKFLLDFLKERSIGHQIQERIDALEYMIRKES